MPAGVDFAPKNHCDDSGNLTVQEKSDRTVSAETPYLEDEVAQDTLVDTWDRLKVLADNCWKSDNGKPEGSRLAAWVPTSEDDGLRFGPIESGHTTFGERAKRSSVTPLLRRAFGRTGSQCTIPCCLVEHLTDATPIWKERQNDFNSPLKHLDCRKKNQLNYFMWFILILLVLIGFFCQGASAMNVNKEGRYTFTNGAYANPDGSLVLLSNNWHSGCAFYNRRYPLVHPVKARRTSFEFVCVFKKHEYTSPALEGHTLKLIMTSEPEIPNSLSQHTVSVEFAKNKVTLMVGSLSESATIKDFKQMLWVAKASIDLDAISSTISVWLKPSAEPLLKLSTVDLASVFIDNIRVGLCSKKDDGEPLVITQWRFNILERGLPSPPPAPIEFNPDRPTKKASPALTAPPPELWQPPPATPSPPSPHKGSYGEVESSTGTLHRSRRIFLDVVMLVLAVLVALILLFLGLDWFSPNRQYVRMNNKSPLPNPSTEIGSAIQSTARVSSPTKTEKKRSRARLRRGRSLPHTDLTSSSFSPYNLNDKVSSA